MTTSEDFGTQGELPTHPELLDWMAVEFMERNWDMQRMLKQIVMSATYRQSSKVTPDRLEKDPDNRWLSRGGTVPHVGRDDPRPVTGPQWIAQPKMYGPPVRPATAEAGTDSGVRRFDRLGDQCRRGSLPRGLYTQFRRSNPYPSMMAAFDAPIAKSARCGASARIPRCRRW